MSGLGGETHYGFVDGAEFFSIECALRDALTVQACEVPDDAKARTIANAQLSRQCRDNLLTAPLAGWIDDLNVSRRH